MEELQGEEENGREQIPLKSRKTEGQSGLDSVCLHSALGTNNP